MKYKLIVSDYDNTICNRDKVVTARTKKAIKDFTDNGGRFVMCTTRPYIGAKNQALELGLKDEIITNQGACITNLADDSVVFNSTLSFEQCKEIMDLLYNKTSHIFVCSHDAMRTKQFDYFAKKCVKVVDYPVKETETSLIDDCKHMDVNQIIFGFYLPPMVKHMAKVAQDTFKDKYKVGVCDKYLFNITKNDVSKGMAIERIAKLHGIEKDEIISFGDSLSDGPMFKYSGTGVAMGNAMKGLKDIATTVCGDVEDDGLAKYIEQYCL